MGLETATYISGLTPTWPTSGELKSQGDDHLRLIKATLQATFPAASKPFYFPTTTPITGTLNLVATDQNNIVMVDTTAGNITVNLPSTLAAADKGWSCEVMKTSNDANAALVTPASGNISSKCGATATIRVGILCEPARFIWNGTGWTCSKPGPMIGSTENFDGASVPPGYLLDDGSAFSNTAFAELFAVLGSSTLRDKRGCVEAGVDGAGSRLNSSFFGTASLGTIGGGQSQNLTNVNQLPNGASFPVSGGTVSIFTSGVGALGVISGSAQTGVINTGTSFNVYAADKYAPITGAIAGYSAASGGTGAAFRTVQPTIIVNKIKRAC